MRSLIIPFALGATLLFAAPTQAKTPHGFTSMLDSSITTTEVKLDIQVSEDLNFRANNLPKKRSASGIANRRSGFAQNGYLGDKSIKNLTSRVERRFTQQLEKRGITVSDNAATTLRITLTDAKPNRPTFKQLSKSPNLSFQSFGTGGAELEGELLTASGESAGSMSYNWYETDIRDARFGGTWHDANYSIDRFARRAAKALTQ